MTRVLRVPAAWLGLVLLGLVFLGALGCSESLDDDTGDDLVVYDFIEDLDVAETGYERSRLRIADPDFVERLRSGWGPVETDPEGGSFRWTLGLHADMEVFVAKPRNVTFVCRCEALTWPDAPSQTLQVSVGDRADKDFQDDDFQGERFQSEAVEVSRSSTQILIPSSAWKPGWNRLTLSASRATPPAAVMADSDDTRVLGVRVEALEFRGLFDSKPPFVNGGRLHLPAGSVVRSFGESAGQRWQVAGVEAGGGVGLGTYLLTGTERLPLNEGSLDVPLGDEVAIELVAEPLEATWWRSLLGAGGSSSEVRVRQARVLLSPDRMPTADPVETADRPTTGTASGVIVYMIDTLRADRLGVYGSDLGLTPRMDELAAESIVFTDARAQSSWTRPSVVSTFTGLYPQTHGVDERNDGLAGEVETLAERLWAAGIYTVGVTTNGNVSNRFGVGQGFGEYRHLQEKHSRESVHVLSDELNQWGLHYLKQHRDERGDQPFFLYLHATDPHAPYTPQEPFASRFASSADRGLGTLDSFRALREGEAASDESARDQLLALYDAEVAWTDHQLGLLIDELRQRGLWDDLLFIVVADHGEEFLDHGHWEHGRTLYDEQLRVPLLIKPPAGVGTPRRLSGPAGHVDLAPTVLDALGVDYDPANFDGRSLWPALSGATQEATGATSLSHLELADESLRSVVVGRWKLIEDLNLQRRMLFDVEDDAAELDEMSGEKPLRAGVLGQERRRLERELVPESAEELELDEETKKQLEALGYAG